LAARIASCRIGQSECVNRVGQVDELVKGKAKPWFLHYGLTMEELHRLRTVEGWHDEYSECGEPTGPAASRGRSGAEGVQGRGLLMAW
jgi:hypothetical protein